MEQETTPKKPGLLELLTQWEAEGRNDAEITFLMDNYMDQKAREHDVPLSGSFELTPLCNLSCKMCYVHLTQQQVDQSKHRILTVSEWKHIMQQAIDAGMMNATLTGGECLVYPGFDELYCYLLDQGIETTIKSNGVLITEERIKFFKENAPAGIHISLYGADDDTYEKVTGVRCFTQVYDAIQRIKDANIPLKIAITPNRWMLDNIESVLDLIDHIGVECNMSPGLSIPRKGTGREGDDIDITLDEYMSIYRTRASRAGVILSPVCEERVPDIGDNDKPMHGLKCAAGRSYFCVHWNGELHPCTSLNVVKADLFNNSFVDGWRAINLEVKEYPIPRECNGCKLSSLCTPCVVRHEYAGRKGHANPDICERARRLVAEGLAQI